MSKIKVIYHIGVDVVGQPLTVSHYLNEETVKHVVHKPVQHQGRFVNKSATSPRKII